MSRRLSQPVVEFPLPLHGVDRPLQEALELLRAAEGHLHPLLDLSLLCSTGGYTLTAATGAGTAVPGTRAVADLGEISITDVRVVADGIANVVAATVQVYDVTNGLAIATLPLGTASATVAGAWTRLVPKANDRTLELRVIGNGTNTQTLTAAHFQARTTSFQP